MEAPDVVLCPLVDVEIENIDCIENSDAVDGIIKKETVPLRFKKKPTGKQYVRIASGMVIDLWWQNDMAIKKLSCPLMDTEIDEGICYDIHMNVEGLAPEWTIPEKVLETPDYKKICLQCPNHRDD
jgi:hypothetical protein